VNNHVELKHSRDALSQMARLDGLTGLSNRRTFDDMLDREWRRLARVGQHLSIIMFDVDHFKLYNDTYGHGAGDICLKKVAQCAVNALQRPADMVARYGGEEFVAVLPDTMMVGAAAVAEAIRENVAAENIPHERSPTAKHVTVSLGHVSVVPKAGRPATELVAAADRALYAAKGSGRNRVVAGTAD
jgi:diguanylate cyclase (GGDEF)-like protein